MRIIIIGALAVAASVLAADSQVEREHLLDLTAPGVMFTAPPTEGGGLSFSGQQARRPPLELTLSGIDRSAYRLGEDATYEVTLKNTSKASIDLPWSVDLAKIFAAGAPTVRGGLALTIEDAGDPNARLALVSLAGSPSVEESILHLAPNEKAVIRAQRATVLESELGLRVTGLGVTRVRAEFTLRTDDAVLWQPLLSKNSVPIQFHLGRR